MNPQTPRIGSDYTTRAGYMADYRKRNREAINARKRRWSQERKQKLANERASRWKNVLEQALNPAPVLAFAANDPNDIGSSGGESDSHGGEARESTTHYPVGTKEPQDSRGGIQNL